MNRRRRTLAQKKAVIMAPRNPRDLFMPRNKELEESCASCPFRKDNDKEFGEVMTRLAKAGSDGYAFEEVISDTMSPQAVVRARQLIADDCTFQGEFVCHGTAYTYDMELRPRSQHRQCPGATAYFKSCASDPPAGMKKR